MKKLELHEKQFDYDKSTIKNVVIDGYHTSKMKDHLSTTRGAFTSNHILSNAIKATPFFADPTINHSNSKILCLGKVQSGKTAFFITAIALAFDNGYDICMVFGGTKNTLLDQSLSRLEEDFSNNRKVVILIMSQTNGTEILTKISEGYKVILVVLKNVSSKTTNLYEALNLSNLLFDIPTLIIDDESDEHTPGAPKLKSKNPKSGITHDVISDILESYKNVTMMFVTATPQANLLLSTMDRLTPDYAVLVEPGEDYTGGEAFHDLITNEHVIDISDSGDFSKSIPRSYKEALKYFMLGVAIMNHKGLNKPYSMLIHPSHLTRVQKNIVEKITEDLDDLVRILGTKSHVVHKLLVSEFNKIYLNEHKSDIPFEVVMDYLIKNLDQFRVFEFNTTSSGKDDIERSSIDNSLFKIYVGGNMLARGVTIPNLTVTYLYRDSKVSAIDTLYQRARWFGYKKKYFDVCRVYMTTELKHKFVAVASSERDLWISLREFLDTDINLRNFNRLFTLDHDSLILTRKTVTNTITFKRIKPGYTYDKSILFNEDDVFSNNKLLSDFLSKYKDISQDINFADGNTQVHKVIEYKYTNIFEDFISKYKFQRNSLIGSKPFERIYDQVINGELSDEIVVIIMRHETGQFRSLSQSGQSIKELPQGYNAGTNYAGDKHLEGYENKMQLQVHLVYTDEEKPNEIIPIIAFNNPLTKHAIRFATGDDYIDKLQIYN